MNILKIAFANIRKRKAAGLTFLIMVMLSALMLSISLSLMFGSANFYDKKVEELNAPHFAGFYTSESYKDEFTEFAENFEGKTDISDGSSLCAVGTWKFGSASNTGTVFLMDESESTTSFYKPAIWDKQQNKSKDMIVLPISFKANGAKAGEKITLQLNDKNYQFTVYGFYEDALSGSSTMGMSLVYTDTRYYAELKTDENFGSYTSLMLRFEDASAATVFKSEFGKFANLKRNEEFTQTFDMAKPSAMMFIDMLSAVLIAFSLIILLIAFIIVSFSISTSIAEDITTIGALKSIGYKNKALKLSQLVQYLIIALIGSVIGAFISLFTFGFIGNIIASTSGLLWLTEANVMPIIITILITCGLTCLITFIATRSYKKITPINALRQGDSTHSFKKNVMPLERSKMSLDLHLGIKKFATSVKNGITLLIVVSLLVFVSSVVFTMSYNLNEDRTAMIQMVGLEMAELYVQANPGVDINDLNTAILADAEVSRTKLSGMKNCAINGFETYAEAMEDYSGLIIDTVVKGKYPSLVNEVTLGAVTAKAINKDVGDTVNIEINGITLNYYVVGITQNIANGGDGCGMLYESVRAHDDKFSFDTLYVYLKEGVNAKAYSGQLKGLYGSKIMIADTDEQMDSILSSLGDPFAAISVIMIIVTVLVIAFVLFLIINTLIRKQKRDLGIMKAIGFKNRRLILQIVISFLPSLLLGTAVGLILGLTLVNPLMSVMFSSMGLMKTYFIIPVLRTLLVGLCIFGASMAAAYLVSTRIKKVSPQRLIAEQ